MTPELITELQHTAKALKEACGLFTNENIDRIPSYGGWSGGQVMEHLEKAVSAEMLYADAKPAERDADEKVEMIKGVFLDYQSKYQSPEFIVPDKDSHDINYYTDYFSHTFNELIKAASESDIEQIPVNFELPGFGELTRLELICLMMYHTQRHTRQLQNIAAALS